MTAPKLTITGVDAQEIRSHVATYVKPKAGMGWTEVQVVRECDHGCKLHVRRRGCVNEYAVIHYRGYGCPLDVPATRIVPVKVSAGSK